MAVDAGFRPTSLLLRKQPHSKWDEMDFLVFEALEIFRIEHSPSHGEASYITRSGAANLRTVVREKVDINDEAIDDYDEANRAKKKPPKGITRWAEVLYVDTEEGRSLPVPRGGRAREIYMAMGEKLTTLEQTGLLNEDLDIEVKKPVGGYNPADYGDGV